MFDSSCRVRSWCLTSHMRIHWHPWLFNKHGFKMIITWFIIFYSQNTSPPQKQTYTSTSNTSMPCRKSLSLIRSLLTGESRPVPKHLHETVIGCSRHVGSQACRIRATRVGQRQRRESNRPTGGTRRGNGQHGASTTLCGCSGQNLCAKCDDLGCVDCIGILEGCVFLLWFLKREVCRVTCLEVYLFKRREADIGFWSPSKFWDFEGEHVFVQPTKSKVWFCMVSSGSVHMPFAKHHGSAFLTCEHMLFALKFGLSVSRLHRNRKFQDVFFDMFVVLKNTVLHFFARENSKDLSWNDWKRWLTKGNVCPEWP